MPGLTGLLRTAVLRVLSWCMAGLAYSVYGYADWIARMGVPFTAEDEFLYAWAGLIGVYPKPAGAATGTANFTGNPGRLLPDQTPLTRQDGTSYQTTADGTVDGRNLLTVPIAATVQGAFTNDPGGTQIAIATPIAGINSSGTTGVCTGGADAETQDALRTRMLFQYRNPPQGGDADDYIGWALQVPGVTRAWCTGTALGPGTVSVYVMFDGQDSGFPIGHGRRLAARTAAGDERRLGRPAARRRSHLSGCSRSPRWSTSYRRCPIRSMSPSKRCRRATRRRKTRSAPRSRTCCWSRARRGAPSIPSQFYEAILAIPGIDHFVMSSPSAELNLPAGHLHRGFGQQNQPRAHCS